MIDTSSRAILYPVFAMFYLTAVVLARMAYLRVGAIGAGKMNVGFYRTYTGEEEPEHLRVVTRHFINLLEVPVLFYVVSLMAYVTHQASTWLVGCAWTYVVLRFVHSYIHLTSNNVLMRFRAYIASGVVLLVMWTSLLIALARGA